MAVFGHEEPEIGRMVIAGAGHVGRFLAGLIREEHPAVNAKIIEASKTQAERAAVGLPGVTVLNGDALDPEILNEANVPAAEAIVAVTNDEWDEPTFSPRS